jgi:protein involved in polysaccharide export with SLBB domain
MRVTCFLSLGALTLVLLASRETSAQQSARSETAQATGQAESVGDGRTTVTPAERNPRYKICVEDRIALSFPLTPVMDQKVMVNPDGYITLRGAGNLHAAGLTVPELVAAVKKSYDNVLHEPLVNADLEDFHRSLFTVLGQVAKPGQYDLRYDTKVTEAVAMAGGFASTAKTQVLLYRSVPSGWEEVRQLNIKEILNGKNISEDVFLRPGDMIFVPEKGVTKFRKYVPYGLGTGISTSL